MSAPTAGIVANELEGARTGVGAVLEGLLRGLAELDAPWRWRLFFQGEPFAHPLWEAGGGRFEPVFDGRSGMRPVLWEQLRLPRLVRGAGLDVFFSPNYALPPGLRAPSLVSLHDLSFEHLPAEFSFRERWRRRLLARRAARSATRVLVGTETMARDLETTYGVARSRIGIVPPAVPQRFREAGADGASVGDRERLAELGVEAPYLLFVGSIFERRAVDVLIRAFAELAGEHPDLRLVLAGANRLRRREELARWIRDSGRSERVAHLGYVPDEALPALYRRAELACYLSTYEGFGIPPLEALACGTAAVISPGQALDDLWPAYPYRCPARDPEQVTATLRRALADPGERRAVAREGAERVRRLDGRSSAERLVAEMERAIRDATGKAGRP